MFKKLESLMKSKHTKKGVNLAKDFAVEQAKEQVESVKFSLKMYLYGFLAIILLVVGILSVGFYKVITL